MPGGDAFREDQGQPLGHQLADDQRDIGDADDHEQGGEYSGVGVQRRKGRLENLIQVAGDRRLTEGARQNSDQGDPDLHRRKEMGRVLRQLQRRPGAAVAAFGPALEFGFP
jgi:hypothetical protein